MLGYPGAFPQQRVERLMSDYFRHARDRHARARAGSARRRRRRSAPNLGQTRDGIGFIDARQAAVQPATWLAAFQAAIDARLRRLRRGAGAASASTPSASASRTSSPTPRAPRRRCCVSCSPAPGCTRDCRRCTTAASLGRMFPPFQAITCRVVRDFFHKYTVDEHTLLTIRNLERLATRAAPDRERFCVAAPGSRGAGAARARRCCSTTSASGATRTTPPRACAWRSDMFERLGLAGRSSATPSSS